MKYFIFAFVLSALGGFLASSVYIDNFVLSLDEDLGVILGCFLYFVSISVFFNRETKDKKGVLFSLIFFVCGIGASILVHYVILFESIVNGIKLTQ